MKKNIYIIEEICDFYPEHVFECGQCFRWNRQEDGSYTGIAGGKVVNVRFEPADLERKTGRLVLTGCREEDFEGFWRHYLDLNRDYGKIKGQLGRGDKVMRKATSFGWGIRILNQDLWETIVSFIISQNNNIPRIKGCIEKLAELYGEPVMTECESLAADYSGEANAKRWYTLPTPEKLASLSIEDLAPVKLGYRAKYLIETAKAVGNQGLPQNREELTGLCGVGPKVAGCIALFGMNCRDSFPIDVWVARVMHQLYGLEEKDKAAMAAFARKKFGKLGGFAQQYLFYYMRENFQQEILC